MNVPKLRFGEFNKEWKCKNLGDIAQFSKGKGIAKADISTDGQFECIRYGELYTHYKETIKQVISRTNLSADELVFSDANDVIIPASGETQLDIATASCVLKKGVALGGDLNIIKSDANGVFLSYYLNNAKKQSIANIAQGISVVHLYASQLKTLELNVPEPDEQQKIADFLSAVDDKITALTAQKTALTQYKQGMMQCIFAQTLRFKDDNGADYPEWRYSTISELSINGFSNGVFNDPKKVGSGYRLINVKDMYVKGSIDPTTLFKVDIDPSEFEKNKVLYGDIFFTRSSLVKEGIAYSNVFLKHDEDVTFDGHLIRMRPDLANTSPKFLYYLFKTDNVRNQFIARGKTATMTTIGQADIAQVQINIPDLSEQQKIAQFLTELDEKINAVDAQIQSAQQWKQGLLQQMFI